MLLSSNFLGFLAFAVTVVAAPPSDVSSALLPGAVETEITPSNTVSETRTSSFINGFLSSFKRNLALSPRQDDGGNGDDEENEVEYDGDDVAAATTTVRVAIQHAATTTSSSSSTALPTSSPGVWDGCHWTIDGTKKFTSRMHVPYAGWNSSYFNSTLSDRPFNKTDGVLHGDGDYRSDLVTIGATGGLHLNVIGSANVPPTKFWSPGSDGFAVAQSAEISTSWSDIKYGSVRTLAKGTTSAGAIYGMFFYRYDKVGPGYYNETDIELRTWNTTMMYGSNQAANATSYTTNVTLDASFDGAFHEYRIDWTPGLTQFYVDGQYKFSNKVSVPTREGSWKWNAWSSNHSWSDGVAIQNNTFYIGGIDLYVNRTTVSGCGKYIA